MNSSANTWYLITIIDPSGLPGKSIYDIIQLILKSVKFNFIIIDDIYGAAETVTYLQTKENTIMKVDEFLDVVTSVIQFDWGDFFLFEQYPEKWENNKKLLYPNVVSQTDTTVRAVDDTYIYVYTPYEQIEKNILENYEIESVKKDILENLDFPE